jgi:uncharacterized protein (DUF983 family)
MFLLNNIAGLNGILWATPMADTVAVIVTSVLLAKHIKGQIIRRQEIETESQ